MKLIDALTAQPLAGRQLMSVARANMKTKIFTRLCDSGLPFSQALYNHIYSSDNACKECGEPTLFKSFYRGYNPFCSRLCASKQDKPPAKEVEYAHDKRLADIWVKKRDITNSAETLAVATDSVKADVAKYVKRFKAPAKQVMYHMFVSSPVPVCKECGERQTRFVSVVQGYNAYCSRHCGLVAGRRLFAQDTDRKELAAKRTRATSLKRYGVEHYTQADSVLAKKEKTNLKRYGHKSAMQNPEVSQRSFMNCFVPKTTVVNGREFSYLGYENWGLQILADEFGVANIESRKKKIPVIRYARKGVERNYFPDVFVKSANLIVEVKSLWTSGLMDTTQRGQFSTLRAKARAVRKAGYRFVCLVFDKQGQLVLRSGLKKNRAYYMNAIYGDR